MCICVVLRKTYTLDFLFKRSPGLCWTNSSEDLASSCSPHPPSPGTNRDVQVTSQQPCVCVCVCVCVCEVKMEWFPWLGEFCYRRSKPELHTATLAPICSHSSSTLKSFCFLKVKSRVDWRGTFEDSNTSGKNQQDLKFLLLPVSATYWPGTEGKQTSINLKSIFFHKRVTSMMTYICFCL